MSEHYDLFDRLLARDAGLGLDRPRARPRLPEVFEHAGAFAEQDIEVPVAPPPARPAPAEPPAPVEPSVPAETPALVQFLERSVVHRIEERRRPAGPAPVAFPQIVERMTERVVEQPGSRPRLPSSAPAPAEVVRETEAAPRQPVPQPVERRWHATGRPAELDRQVARDATQRRRRDIAARQEPVVQISIGRLEVTAAGAGADAPAKPAAGDRPGRPAAMVSLDDFLARDNGGGRG
jgi:hypothetical protein